MDQCNSADLILLSCIISKLYKLYHSWKNRKTSVTLEVILLICEAELHVISAIAIELFYYGYYE